MRYFFAVCGHNLDKYQFLTVETGFFGVKRCVFLYLFCFLAQKMAKSMVILRKMFNFAG
jgi:hypothetical protein